MKFQVAWILKENNEIEELFAAFLKTCRLEKTEIVVVGNKENVETLKRNMGNNYLVSHIQFDVRPQNSETFSMQDLIESQHLKKENDYFTAMWNSSVIAAYNWQEMVEQVFENDDIVGVFPQIIFSNTMAEQSSLKVLGDSAEEQISGSISEQERLCCIFRQEFLNGNREKIFEVDLIRKAEAFGKKIVRRGDFVVGIYGNNSFIKENVVMNKLNFRRKILEKMQLGGKKNILYFLLADFDEDCWNHMGGTQLHVKDLTEGLKKDYNIFVLARDNQYIRLTEYTEKNKMVFRFFVGGVSSDQQFYNKDFAELFFNILKAFQIDILHVHHTLWMSLDIFEQAEKLDIPIIYTIHDYYCICPVLSLVDLQDEICVQKGNEDNCNVCIEQRKGIDRNFGYISWWRKNYLVALQKCSHLIAPSESVKEVIEEYYPELREKIKIIPHGIYLADNIEKKKKERDRKVLNIAFIGDIGKQKGSDLVREIIQNGNQSSYRWFLFGGIGDQELLNLKQKNLIKYGWYKREELSGLLHKYKIDIVCILSSVPETYSYTYSEAISNKIPLIVTDIGALGERMRRDKCGWIVPPQSGSRKILELLKRIQENPEEYQQKIQKLEHVENMDIGTMLSKYRELYEIFPKKNDIHMFDWHVIEKGMSDEEVNQIKGNKEDSVKKLKDELSEIKNSKEYRLGDYLYRKYQFIRKFKK